MLTKDKFGDTMFAELYTNYGKMTLPEFREYCISLILNNTVSAKAKKDTFVRSLEGDRNKDRMVKRITDIMLAGEGMSTGSAWQKT